MIRFIAGLIIGIGLGMMLYGISDADELEEGEIK